MEIGGHRAAPPDLDNVAEAFGAGRLAHQAMVHLLAIGLHPVENRHGAIHRVAFLVPGDQQRDGALS